MMEAGFTIEASWPVATQSVSSLHHAAKNSAKSTIMLVCRKRRDGADSETFFEDIEAELRQAARRAVEKFEAEVGVGGVDLQLATYGPTLSVISRNWPVLSSEPDETGRSRRLRPEEALDVARQEVSRLRMQRLVGKDASFDAATDFWLMCWETFKAREFPFDEARKLALGVGYDVEEAIKSGLIGKKASDVELISPLARGRVLRKLMDDRGRLPRLVDALHLMLVTYRDDKLAAARTWLADSGYGEEQQFRDVVQAAMNAVPRVRGKKGLTVEEALLLEDAVVGMFGDEISIPVEAQEQIAAAQMTLEG
jgi:adenine-specific DNA methylase